MQKFFNRFLCWMHFFMDPERVAPLPSISRPSALDLYNRRRACKR